MFRLSWNKNKFWNIGISHAMNIPIFEGFYFIVMLDFLTMKDKHTLFIFLSQIKYCNI